MKKTKLKEIATVTSGIRPMRYTEENGEFEYKQLKLKKEYDKPISVDDMEIIKSDKLIDDDHILKKGDIIMKLTPEFDARVFDINADNIIIPHTYALIRVFGDIDPYLLAFYLNGRKIKKQIHILSDSSTMRIMNITNIKNLEIDRKLMKEEKYAANLVKLFYEKKNLIERQLEIEERILFESLNR